MWYNLQWWHGEVSYKDLLADLLGTLLALLLLFLWDRQQASAANKKNKIIDLELGVLYGATIRRARTTGLKGLRYLQVGGYNPYRAGPSR